MAKVPDFWDRLFDSPDLMVGAVSAREGSLAATRRLVRRLRASYGRSGMQTRSRIRQNRDGGWSFRVSLAPPRKERTSG